MKAISGFHNEIGGQGAFAVALEFESSAVGLLQLNSQRIWKRNFDRMKSLDRANTLSLKAYGA